LEKRLPGGAGIVLDDVAAGIFANLILRGVLIFWTPC
jgi:phosphatidylglycerophosphatase A